MAVDWSGWPVLEVRAADLQPHELPTLVGAALSEAIGRGEPFVVVMEPPDLPKRGRVRDAVEQVRMVRRLRPGLARHCPERAAGVWTDEHAGPREERAGVCARRREDPTHLPIPLHSRPAKRRAEARQSNTGLAMVLPADAIQDNAKVIKAGPKIWGCPVNAVPDLATARAWARGQLEGV